MSEMRITATPRSFFKKKNIFIISLLVPVFYSVEFRDLFFSFFFFAFWLVGLFRP